MFVKLSLAQGREGTSMSPPAQSDPKAVIAEWVDAMNKHDLGAVAAIFASEYHDVEAVRQPGR